MANANPWLLRDFRQGRYTPSSISNFLAPDNSVASSVNINYDEIVGSAKVRPGTTKVGSTVSANHIPLGLNTFVGPSGSPNYIVAVFKQNTSTSTSSSSSSSVSTSSSSSSSS